MEKRGYLAIALVAAAVVLFEVAITRVLSVVLWYHLTFLSLSIAMLGLGVPGVWFALRRPGPNALRRSLLVSGAALPVSVAALIQFGRAFALDRDTDMLVSLAGVCIAIPMLALGSAVCLLLIAAPGRRIGRMYGADLLGATAGALLVLPLMHLVPTPLLIAGTGLLPLAAVLVACRPVSRTAIGLVVALAIVLAWGTPFHLTWNKSFEETETPLFERWSPTARITLHREHASFSGDENAWGWGFGSKYVPTPAPYMWLEQDGAAGTPVQRFDGDVAGGLEHLLFDVTSVGYQLRRPSRVCVIGAGGGRDVLTALKAGATSVDAVELSPAIVEAVSGPAGDYSGNLYHLPGVNAVISEGRSFLTRTTERYDVIQVSLVDSWAASSAGAFALTENYLYTEEAFRLYWNRLSDTGTLSVSRWMMGDHQMETARLALLARHALTQEGVEAPDRHLAIMGAGEISTLLMSREAFDAPELARLDSVAEERGFRRHWPHPAGAEAASIVSFVLDLNGREHFESLGFDLSPPTDDRPFFFQTVDILSGVDPQGTVRVSYNERSVNLLRQLVLGLSAFALVLFFLPFALGGRMARGPGFWSGSVYFACIGMAFMFAELAWIQRFILYLGHPSYATTVVLAALLLGAGLGSLAAAQVPGKLIVRLGLLLPLAVAVQTLVSPAIFGATLGAPFAARIALSVALLAPVGFLMGFAFPTGMVHFGEPHKPWFWAMNGALGVLGSVASIALFMALGIQNVALLAVGLYLVAVLLLTRTKPA